MTPMRTLLCLVTVVLFLGAVACGRREPRDASRYDNSQRTLQVDARRQDKDARRAAKRRARDERADLRGPRQQQQQAQLSQPVGPVTPGTCEASCVHYLQCKAIYADAEEMQTCVGDCRGMRLTPQALSGYEQTDCATAIRVVEGGGNTNPSNASSGSDCAGCVWDGSSCIWLSSSDWGAGAYSGGYTSCSSSCCRGH